MELNCPTRIFATDDAANHLDDIDIVVNVAGPFSVTQDGLIKGCIHSKTHYVDIAGEYAEMENAFKYHLEAQNAGIIILPAAGFGVVPTDIAAKLAGRKPNCRLSSPRVSHLLVNDLADVIPFAALESGS